MSESDRLTIMDKINILSYINDGMTTESISKLCGITDEIINNIQQNREAITAVFEYCLKCQHLPLKNGLYPQMENILFSWYVEQPRVPNKALTEKAKEIINILNESPTSGNAGNFSGSLNWINGFKGRYGIPILQRKSNMLSTNNRDEISFFGTGSLNTSAKLVRFEAEPEELKVQDIPTPPKYDLDIETGDDENNHENFSDGVIDAQVEQMNRKTDVNRDLDGDNKDNEDDHLQPKKRKRPTIDVDDDSSSEDFSDSESLNEPKRKKIEGVEKVLVPTRDGLKLMSLQDYEVYRVIRIFKPVLKYSEDMGWSSEDSDVLNKLYEKSLKCGGKTKQSTITQFFREKK